MGHTSTIIDNKIYIFGGLVKEELYTYNGDLEIYDLSTNRWSSALIYTKNIMKMRRNHSATNIGGQIFVYGGLSEDNEVLNDSYLLNINPLRWQNVSFKPQKVIHVDDDHSPKNNNKNIAMTINPPYLYGHQSCLVLPKEISKNPKFTIHKFPETTFSMGSILKINSNIKDKGLYIFGGKTQNESYNNQMYILKLGKKPLEFRKLNCSGQGPCGRTLFSMNFLEEHNILVIYGGRNDVEPKIPEMTLEKRQYGRSSVNKNRSQSQENSNSLDSKNKVYFGNQLENKNLNRKMSLVKYTENKPFDGDNSNLKIKEDKLINVNSKESKNLSKKSLFKVHFNPNLENDDKVDDIILKKFNEYKMQQKKNKEINNLNNEYALSDMWILELSTLDWVRVYLSYEDSKVMTYPRCGHSSFVHDKKIYIFGGMNSKTFLGSHLLCIDFLYKKNNFKQNKKTNNNKNSIKEKNLASNNLSFASPKKMLVNGLFFIQNNDSFNKDI